MPKILNPIIPGFHPDPDIIRVGNNYYIATTTFEWLPGINIHHSKDLINWTLISHALDDRHLHGASFPDSGGNYIPSLSYRNGTYYIVYSEVYKENWPNVANRSYLITTNDIRGKWSDPIYLNSIAFDPSIFIDNDDRIYILNLIMETRMEKGPQMQGFMIQEFSEKEGKLRGKPETIFETTDWDLQPEGPHLYHIGDYYYIMCAIHGTKWEHGTLFMRSKSLFGPYELAPQHPMLSSKGDRSHSLQKAGQGCIVDTPNGDWYLTHHSSRPIAETNHCPLGRETCLQKIRWNASGWPELDTNEASVLPQLEVEAQGSNYSAKNPAAEISFSDEFNTDKLDINWNSLREMPKENWVSLKRTEGKLSLRGRQPLGSIFENSIIAQRWKSQFFEAETLVRFNPTYFRQSAGLIAYYNSTDFAFAYLTHDEEMGTVLNFVQHVSNLKYHQFPRSKKNIPPPVNEVKLKLTVQEKVMQFHYYQNDRWKPLSPELSSLHLSDEGPDGSLMRFTGAFVGLAATDCLTESLWAEFDYFKITPICSE